MKKLLIVLGLLLSPAWAFGAPDYFKALDFVIEGQSFQDSQRCLSGVEATIQYYQDQPVNVMVLRNFIQGECAYQVGQVVEVPGYPPRSYQHESGWRAYSIQFDGQENDGTLHFSGTGVHFDNNMTRVQWIDRSLVQSPIPHNYRIVVRELHSEGYISTYLYLGPSPILGEVKN